MVNAADSEDFEYTGASETRKLPPGKYLLETWGANGGLNRNGGIIPSAGVGGYSKGIITLTTTTDITVYVGGKGGNGSGSYGAGGGGGSSDIRINTDSPNNRVIVAGRRWRIWLSRHLGSRRQWWWIR